MSGRGIIGESIEGIMGRNMIERRIYKRYYQIAIVEEILLNTELRERERCTKIDRVIGWKVGED